MAESKQVSIVLLKGPHYGTWKVLCTMALKNDRVWGIVSGTGEAPACDVDQRSWNAMPGGET